MDKTTDKVSRGLIIAIGIIWSALFCLLFVFIRTVSNKEVVLEERVDHIETAFAANPAELLSAPSIDERISYSRQQALKQKSILEQSIALCKNEYAERIARAVITEHSRQGIPIPVAYALIGTESDKTHTDNISLENSGYFKPTAKSKANCRGLTQLSLDTLNDFNTFNKFGHHYTWDDMYDIEKNIEVGVWHYMRYVPYIGEDWINLYIVYNVGYTRYTNKNQYWMYNDYTEQWERHANDWYFRNSKYPPTGTNLRFKNLTGFAPTKRFTIYYNMYTEIYEDD